MLSKSSNFIPEKSEVEDDGVKVLDPGRIKLTLLRGPSTDLGTFGRMIVPRGTNGNRFDIEFATLEPPWRENERQFSCIPEGVYIARLSFSPGFQKQLYELEGVPGRGEVLIHNGNWAGDRKKGYVSNSKGCILIGQKQASIMLPGGNYQLGVTRSVASLKAFHQIVCPNSIELTIRKEVP